MGTCFFTNRGDNTLLKEFDNLLSNNPHIKNLDAVVGFLRASGYFSLRPFLDNINKVRILIGINVDKYIADAANRGEIFFSEEGKVKDEYLLRYQQDIEHSPYTQEVERGMLQMVEDIIDGKLEVRAHPAKSIHAKIYVLYPDGLNEHTIGAATITGSSNLTGNGMGITHEHQYEFNVLVQESNLVLDAAKRGLNASVVFPSGIIGPGDIGKGSITNMLLCYLSGKMPFAVKGGYDFVDVRDVASGIVACAERGESGKGYILSGNYATIHDILNLAKAESGITRNPIYLPICFAKMAAPFVEKRNLRKNRPLYFTPYSIETLRSNGRFNRSAAETRLGYSPRSLKSSISDTVRWIYNNAMHLPSKKESH